MFEDFRKHKLPILVSFWLFLLFFIGNSFLSNYLLILFVIGSVFFWKNIDFSKFNLIKKFSVTWLILLIYSTISLFWSSNFPLSFDYLVFLIFSYYFFHFFFLIDKKVFDFKYFVTSLSFVSLILIIFSLFFSVFAQFGNQLPEMNILYSSTGHVHLSLISLFLVPLLLFYSIKGRNKRYLFTSGLFSLFTFLSMGRILSVILVIQHLLIFFSIRHKLKNKAFIKNFYSYYKSIIFIVLFLVTSWLLVSLGCNTNKDSFSLAEIKVCRVGSGVSRVRYWKTAVEIIKNKPMLGVGLNNYSLFSKKYIEDRVSTSSYPHNFFLKMFADIGIAGGLLFSFLFIGMLFRDFKNKVVKNKNFNFFLFISLFGVFVNSFFDYDWNFEVIFVLTLIFLASFTFKNNIKRTTQSKSLKKTFFISWILCLLFMFFYILIDVMVFSERDRVAFSVFPASKWHSVVYAKSDKLSLEEKDLVFSINRNNSIVLRALSEGNISNDFKKKILNRLNDVDPWSSFYLSLNYLKDDSFTLLERERIIYEQVKFLQHRKETYGEVLSDDDLSIFIDNIFVVADELYLNRNYERSGRLYVLSTKMNSWSLDVHEPVFIDKGIDENIFLFFLAFEDVRFRYLGSYGYDYYFYLENSMNLYLRSEIYNQEKYELGLKTYNLWSKR